MPDVIAEALALLQPALSPALVAPAAAERLWQASRWLAPIPRIGLECRLKPGAPQVDLQQAVTADDPDEPARFAAHLHALIAHAETPLPAAWHRLAALADAWRDEPSLRACIRELWLEFDLPDEGAAPTAPSLFVGFHENTRSVAGSRDVLARVLSLLRERPVPQRLWENVCRCFDARPLGAFISHVGIMLARPVDALRVELKGVPLDRIVPYLQAVGWAGDADELEKVAIWLSGYFDALMMGFDVAEQVLPSVGLECFPKAQFGHDRWHGFLDDLVAHGLCSPERRDALLAWPGRITPLTSQAPWPASLLIESFRQPPDRFSVFERRTNHVKISYHPDAPLQAKAYLGFGHLWATVAAPRPTAPEVAPPAASPMAARRTPPTPALVDQAMQKATAFLAGARSQNGWWMDFERIGEKSDEWATAVVGLTLAEAPVEAGPAVRQAWDALAGRRPQAGWAWNILFDGDADSTAWGLLFARAIGEHTSARARHAIHTLKRHLRPGGAVVTYADDPLLRDLTGYANLDGWCGAHTCVAASVAILPDFRDAVCPYLHATQRPDGSWAAYWWADDEYATTQAVEALVRRGTPEDLRRVARAATWAARRIGPAGAILADGRTGPSACVTALLVRLLALAGGPAETVTAGVGWLLDHQHADGSWTPSARLRVPPPDSLDYDHDPPGTALYLDHAGLFTTACALRALTAAQARLESGDTPHTAPLRARAGRVVSR